MDRRPYYGQLMGAAKNKAHGQVDHLHRVFSVFLLARTVDDVLHAVNLQSKSAPSTIAAWGK